MKKSVIILVGILMLFSSCETLDNLTSQLFQTGNSEKISDSGEVKVKQPRYTKDKIDTIIWDLSVLDTARDVDYMFEVEKNVVLE